MQSVNEIPPITISNSVVSTWEDVTETDSSFGIIDDDALHTNEAEMDYSSTGSADENFVNESSYYQSWQSINITDNSIFADNSTPLNVTSNRTDSTNSAIINSIFVSFPNISSNNSAFNNLNFTVPTRPSPKLVEANFTNSNSNVTDPYKTVSPGYVTTNNESIPTGSSYTTSNESRGDDTGYTDYSSEDSLLSNDYSYIDMTAIRVVAVGLRSRILFSCPLKADSQIVHLI